MLDSLFALGQFFCVLGLIYGLILVIAHGDCVDEMRPHYDPITGHDWLTIRIVREESASRAAASTGGQIQDQSSARISEVS